MNALYRMLLWLYPSGFRREYGEAMAALFAERVGAAGGAERLRLLLGAIPELMLGAAALHWEILRQDLRHTMRALRRTPAFAVTAIVVTAIGVGANTAAFSVADFVLLRPLSFPDAESLVRLCEGPRTGPVGWGCMNQLSPANYRDLKEQTTSFAAMGAFQRDAMNLVDGGEPQRVATARITAEVLPLLGAQPVIGRVLDDAAVRADERAVVIGYAMWQTRLGGDRNVLGRTIHLDGTPHTVIGVMPPTFHFPTRDVQLWIPLSFNEQDYSTRGNSYIEAVGRLAPGVTFEEARRDLDAAVDRIARAYPDTEEELGVSFFLLRDEFSPRYRTMLRALCGAALCILLLACANLGNLLLARASDRERELAVRSALGAGRERLVRQLITESMTLAVIGGVAGVLVALASFPLLSLLIPSSLPIGGEPAVNLRMLGVAALFTGVTAFGYGVLPALRSGGSALTALRGGRADRRKQRHRFVLVAVEVAASVVLLVASGLLIRAMLRVQAIDPGFRSESVLTLRTVLPKPKYIEIERREQYYRDVLTNVRALPGVQYAAFTSGLPMIVTGNLTRVVLPGVEVQRNGEYLVSRRFVTAQFFGALGIPLVSGRDFQDADAASGQRVAVVSESFVQRYWPGEDGIGKSFLYLDSARTVIGVVGDIKVRGLERNSEPQMYLPSSHGPNGAFTAFDPKDLVIRTNGDPTTLLPTVRDIIHRADPEQPISDVMTLDDLLALQTAPRAAQVRVLGALAVIAVLLAALGIHGLLAYMVAQRRREIGVRLALGAAPQRIARRVIWEGLSIVIIAMIPGLLIAIVGARSMSALLFGIPPLDPPTITVTVLLCVSTAIVGASIPAFRAVRTSPMTVMRAE